MAKLLKQKPDKGDEKEVVHTPDPMLEQVDEDRSLEIEYDEETNELVLVCHYRRAWGDGFDADVEHGFNLEETNDLIVNLLGVFEQQKKKAMEQLKVSLDEVSTPSLEEGNPSQGSKLQDDKEEETQG